MKDTVEQFYQRLMQDESMASEYKNVVALAMHNTVWSKRFSKADLDRYVLSEDAANDAGELPLAA